MKFTKQPNRKKSRKPHDTGPYAELAGKGLLPETAAAIAAAAVGDLKSQRLLRDGCINEVLAKPADPFLEIIITLEALFLARLCAMQGDLEDVRKLAGVIYQLSLGLRLAGCGHFGDMLSAQTLSILDGLAGHGDEQAAGQFRELAASEEPHVIQIVRMLDGRAVH